MRADGTHARAGHSLVPRRTGRSRRLRFSRCRATATRRFCAVQLEWHSAQVFVCSTSTARRARRAPSAWLESGGASVLTRRAITHVTSQWRRLASTSTRFSSPTVRPPKLTETRVPKQSAESALVASGSALVFHERPWSSRPFLQSCFTMRYDGSRATLLPTGRPAHIAQSVAGGTRLRVTVRARASGFDAIPRNGRSPGRRLRIASSGVPAVTDAGCARTVPSVQLHAATKIGLCATTRRRRADRQRFPSVVVERGHAS